MVLLEDHQRLLAEKRTFQEEIEKRDVENNRLRLEFTSEIDRLRQEVTVAASARFVFVTGDTRRVSSHRDMAAFS